MSAGDALRDRCAIVGIGETALGRLPRRTALDLAQEASLAALEDAGLAPHEVDGIVSQSPYAEWIGMASIRLGELLGLTPLRWAQDLYLGGATACAMAQLAAQAIVTEQASVVLCAFGEGRSAVPESRRRQAEPEEFLAPFGLMRVQQWYALGCRRHMHEFGTTSRQLGEIAVAQRRHAALTPSATRREPITIEDHQRSRPVVEPLRLLDCCLVSDGGGAFVVTSAARARGLRRRPVLLSGMAQAHPHRDPLQAGSLTTTGAALAGPRAFAMAGLGPEDVDVALLYDCFTYAVLVQLEDYGFCKKGEGGAFVEGGRIALGGALPVNTHGGMLSQANLEGMLHVTEAVTQLRGAAGPRQVPGAQVALVSGNGGVFAAHSTLVLTRGAA